MKLFTLLAGYAAGLAVAMKYRKDTGISKLEKSIDSKTKFTSFIDEVVDIHKTAFADVKGFVKTNFDDVENFDDLQSRVGQIVSDFGNNLEIHLENAKKTGISKKEEITQMAQEFLETHEVTLQEAKSKAISFVGVSEEVIDTWLDKAKSEITAVYEKVQEKLESEVDSPKKSTTRKSAPKKTPEAKSE